MRLALYQPDIPQNCGALIRLGACLGVGVDIIEPCGFLFSDRSFAAPAWIIWSGPRSCAIPLGRRSCRPAPASGSSCSPPRAPAPIWISAFRADDVLLLGRESEGVPAEVHERADARLRIPLKTGMRSLNVAQAGAIVLAEALRQTKGFP